MQRIDEGEAAHGICVTFGEKTFEVSISKEEGGGVGLKFCHLSLLGGAQYMTETSQPKEMKLTSQWTLGQPIMSAKINGKDVVVQVL